MDTSVSSVSYIASIATVTDSSIARDTAMSVVNSIDDTDIGGVASGVGLSLGETVGDLAEGVSIGVSLWLRISLTLAIEATVATIDTTIASVSSIASIATVTDSSIARDTAMSVVNSSDDTDIVGVA